MNLEELLSQAVATWLDGFTLYQLADGRWQANGRRRESKGWRVFYGATPVEAAKGALDPNPVKLAVSNASVFE